MNATDILAMRILIVDDEIDNVQLLEKILTREGFNNIVSTTDPTRTLDLVIAFDPDLVLLDLMMPEFDGYAVLEQLARCTPKNDFRPVMVLTADAMSEAKHRALALGAKDFLTKPFDFVESILRISNLLETRLLYKRLHALIPNETPVPPWHLKLN
ncbi:response regulator [Undibacterium sp. RuTC16W]|uniref:response regulator n=1 Tax=Undibacterium sp. RuTC16W TaxID=3413048 RepID=UPI003BF3E58F